MPIKIRWSYNSIRILRYILDYQDRRGYSPTLLEIQKKLHFKSHNTAVYHIGRMTSAGLLKRDRGRARTLQIVDIERAIRIVNRSGTETNHERNSRNQTDGDLQRG